MSEKEKYYYLFRIITLILILLIIPIIIYYQPKIDHYNYLYTSNHDNFYLNISNKFEFVMFFLISIICVLINLVCTLFSYIIFKKAYDSLTFTMIVFGFLIISYFYYQAEHIILYYYIYVTLSWSNYYVFNKFKNNIYKEIFYENHLL